MKLVMRQVRSLHTAIVGSGPAGFYTALRVMNKIPEAKVDMYEQLPVPFGLVRYGVAPDHPEVRERFAEVAASPRFSFHGNISVGHDVSVASLASAYHAVVLAYGAAEDKKLHIPGEESLRGIHAARDLVAWYNGHPDYAHLDFDLSRSESAVIIGQGNVALDVARILLSDVDSLRKTDISERALAALARSVIKHVYVCGRRGAMQAAFTIKELRELMLLPNVTFRELPARCLPEPPLKRTAARMMALLHKGSAEKHGEKSWSLEFMRSPVRFEGTEALTGVTFCENEYVDGDSVRSIEGSEKFLPTELAFRSIGYRSASIPGMEEMGINFDQAKALLVNDHGRLITDQGQPIPGLYCAGWVKRGPTGVIANTMEDSFATADALVSDYLAAKPFLPNHRGLRRPPHATSWSDWLKIDARERGIGDRPRRKLLRRKDMLDVGISPSTDSR